MKDRLEQQHIEFRAEAFGYCKAMSQVLEILRKYKKEVPLELLSEMALVTFK